LKNIFAVLEETPPPRGWYSSPPHSLATSNHFRSKSRAVHASAFYVSCAQLGWTWNTDSPVPLSCFV